MTALTVSSTSCKVNPSVTPTQILLIQKPSTYLSTHGRLGPNRAVVSLLRLPLGRVVVLELAELGLTVGLECAWLEGLLFCEFVFMAINEVSTTGCQNWVTIHQHSSTITWHGRGIVTCEHLGSIQRLLGHSLMMRCRHMLLLEGRASGGWDVGLVGFVGMVPRVYKKYS